ncbi:hypothetical protein NHH73_23975 [Oxalobacteraceae bacterium OTU3CINTB1]|nr:hypothetical protein NHH73_23975 [Oxalobacteraceae bacterium OTU3CINTB1]
MINPEQAAPYPQPYPEQFADFDVHQLPEHTNAPQSWMVTVADARYHWYDLIAGFPERPDIRDPVGRYQRRMQFELEAVAEKHHLFFAVTRPRVRFDTAAAVQWGFFSLKLTLPLLVGGGQAKDSLTIELTVPFAATLKKPTVTMTPTFVTLNWGGLIEAFSIHDILQTYPNHLSAPSRVFHVGQTRDPDARLSRARLPALQKLHAQLGDDVDTLLLVQSMNVHVICDEGDAADLPCNADPRAAEALRAERMDIVEAALIRHFEAAGARGLTLAQRKLGCERLAEVQQMNNLVQFTIDLELPEVGNYDKLCSDQVAPAPSHLLSCFIADGEARVAAMPVPPANGKR